MNTKIILFSTIVFLLKFPVTDAALAQSENITLSGYGGLDFSNVIHNTDSSPAFTNTGRHHVILAAGYYVNDNISLNLEFQAEHSLLNYNEEGTLTLEQAYIDYSILPGLGLRGGLINPHHEPAMFHGIERSNMEQLIIPTGWKETGLGVIGEFSNGLNYEAYVMAGLSMYEIPGSSALSDLLQSDLESRNNYLGVTGRLQYKPSKNLSFTGTYFYSGLNGNTGRDTRTHTHFHMIRAHVVYDKGGFETEMSGILSAITGPESLNGEDAALITRNHRYGGYAALAYDFLPHLNPATDQKLFFFTRSEINNARFGVPEINAGMRFVYEYTFGLTYNPIDKLSLKADYRLRQLRGERDIQQVNIGAGYYF